jgi:hypothetical protein
MIMSFFKQPLSLAGLAADRHLRRRRGRGVGFVFALVYLRRRSALEPIVAHAFSDVLAMLAATMLGK